MLSILKRDGRTLMNNISHFVAIVPTGFIYKKVYGSDNGIVGEIEIFGNSAEGHNMNIVIRYQRVCPHDVKPYNVNIRDYSYSDLDFYDEEEAILKHLETIKNETIRKNVKEPKPEKHYGHRSNVEFLRFVSYVKAKREGREYVDPFPEEPHFGGNHEAFIEEFLKSKEEDKK